jgi:hypothetical protein
MAFLYIGYHHNWQGTPDFRRHWLIFITTERGSNIGTVYDVVQNEEEAWMLRTKENHDISESGTYQDKVVLGLVDKAKLEKLKEILKHMALPGDGEDCQDWVKNAVKKLVAENVAPARALASMGLPPSN